MSAAGRAPHPHPPSRLKVLAAYAAVYVIWGSTYLAIRYAIETLPPLMMAGARFLLAGGVLFVWARARGAERPEPRQWGAAAVIGALLLLGGNGGVVWAERTVPSGVTSLLVATVPLWMVLLDRGEAKRSPRVMTGLLLGLAGFAVLVGPESLAGGSRVDPAGAAVLMVGTIAWSVGSLLSRRLRLPGSKILSTGMQMLTGGALLVAAGALAGETFDPGAASTRSVVAFFYLVVFGAIIGFTAYLWLLGVEPPARVSTYAYVNPLTAMLLGWAIAGEPITGRNALAAAIILAAVVVVLTHRERGASAKAPAAGAPDAERSEARAAR